MMPRKTFAQQVGIDTEEATRPSTWDVFHEITVDMLNKSVEDLKAYCDEWQRMYKKERRRGDRWVLIALLGWGMFVIAWATK